MTAPSTPLRHGRSDGYRLCTWTRGGLTRALVATADDASPPPARSPSPGGPHRRHRRDRDRPAHRRKGMGILIMCALVNVSADQGTRTAVLGATVEDKALCKSLGWHTQAPLTGLILC
ncbi:hypothetical protein [Streptomyces milbemycinicus]|uniref:N-acetyltransferase domain-containing protein n=1 Tax=Streptomyces milbemycinicus TaxID=476552 RepID=A0ABW8LJ63_9ACTN